MSKDVVIEKLKLLQAEKAKTEYWLTKLKHKAEAGDKEAINQLFLFAQKSLYATHRQKTDSLKTGSGLNKTLGVNHDSERYKKKWEIILCAIQTLRETKLDWGDMLAELPLAMGEKKLKFDQRFVDKVINQNKDFIIRYTKTP